MCSPTRNRRHPLTRALLSLGILALVLTGGLFVRTGDADAAPLPFVVQQVKITGEPDDVPLGPAGLTIDIRFNLPPVGTTLTPDNLYIRNIRTGARVPYDTPTFELGDHSHLFIRPNAPLAENTEYDLVLTSDIKALIKMGAVMVPISLQGKTVRFMTTGPPSVRNVMPADEATGVRPDTPIWASFNRAMDASSASSKNYYLHEIPAGVQIPAKVEFTNNNLCHLAPDTLLKSNTQYRVTLMPGPNGVKAKNGKPMTKAFTWTFTTAPAKFPDVESGHDYFTAVEFLANWDVIGGYENGKFGPNDPLSRQQFAKILARAVELKITGTEVCPFRDVDDQLGDDPFYPSKYVAACAAEGYAQGKTATLFGPWDKISRYQVISMVTRAAKDYLPVQKLPPSLWGQWRSDPTHGSNAAWAEYNGLLDGLDLGSLDRWGNMTRGETAQVVYNLVKEIRPQ